MPISDARFFENDTKKKILLFSSFTLALILLSNSFPISVVGATTSPVFGSAINLSNDLGIAKDAAISNNGQNVYVAWTEGSKGILFRMSPDGGATWVPPTSKPALKLGPNGGVAQFPVMFTQFQNVSKGDVYVTWAQTVTQLNGSKILQIFVAASTNNGTSFTRTLLSHNSTHSQITPAIAASGNDVYVAWFSGNTATLNGSDYVTSSKDNGATWGAPVDVVPSERGGEVQIVASGSNAYFVGDGIFFSATYNNGNSWTHSYQLYVAPPRTSTSFYYGREPWIAANGSNVYVTWEANSTMAGISYHDQSETSIDGGLTWGAIQNVTDPLKDNWEPENAAYGSNVFLTFHSLKNQGIYVTSATGVSSNTPTWGATTLLSPTGLKSSFGHIFTSDGVNVFVMWGQQISSGSSTWNAYVSYSADSGSSWSSSPIDISNNAVGVAAGNNDVTLFGLSSNGAHCFAAWTYTNAGLSQIYFAAS
ncbi:MAG: glycoside hydrolase [Thaumarchaeota archaeon]|nr:glycoside hydrolase [Nitrososphaerota archaeon]